MHPPRPDLDSKTVSAPPSGTRGGSRLAAALLPPDADATALTVLVARASRSFADGYVAVLLPAYLLALGFDAFRVGVISTATLTGSAFATIAVGAWGHRASSNGLLRAAAIVMATTGLAFATFRSFAPLVIVAFVGTLNPSSGDVSVFLPLEHARLATSAKGTARTALYARYALVGAFSAAVGALAAGVPDVLVARTGLDRLEALRVMFFVYAALGAVVAWLYRPTSSHGEGAVATPAAPLGPSRRVVLRLAALFSVDSFAGGLVVNSLMSLWLMQRFGLSLAQAGRFFFCTGLLGAFSQLAAPHVARRIGLLHTMVFTHIPANLCLIAAALVPNLHVALALLFVRAALAQMDVPARTAYVMAVVTPAERAAAASFTAVPRSLASAVAPTLGAALFATGYLALPLVSCGVLKTIYDLTLWRACRRDELLDH